MFRRKKTVEDTSVDVPAILPPLDGLDDQHESTPGRLRRTWLWTLIAALVVVALVIYSLVLGIKGIYDGLRDRALENQQLAQEHYELGLAHL